MTPPMPWNPMQPYPPANLRHILDRTRGDWEWLRGGRIFLTGASGFLGSWLLASWLQANRDLDLGGEVHVLTRDTARFRHTFPQVAGDEALRLVEGDQASFPFPEGPFRAVVHAAVEYGMPGQVLMVNLEGFHRVLRFAAGAGAGRVLLTSSGAAYGPLPEGLEAVPETWPGAPDTLDPAQAYGEMKRASEALGAALADQHGFHFLAARCFSFLGPGMPMDRGSAMASLIGDALAARPLSLRGDGTPVRSYLHAADFCIWQWAILSRGTPGRLYNVGSPNPLPLAEVARRVRDLLAPGASLRFESQPEPGNPRRRYVPDITRAREELGLRVTIPLDQAILETGRWIARSETNMEQS